MCPIDNRKVVDYKWLNTGISGCSEDCPYRQGHSENCPNRHPENHPRLEVLFEDGLKEVYELVSVNVGNIKYDEKSN